MRRSRRIVLFVTNRPHWDLAFLKRDVDVRGQYDTELFLLASGGRIHHLTGPDRYRKDAGELFRRNLDLSDIVVLHGDIPGFPAFVKTNVSRKLDEGGYGVLLMPASPWKGRDSWDDLARICPFPGGAELVPAGEGELTAAAPHPIIANGPGADFDEWNEIPPLRSIVTGVPDGGRYVEVITAAIRRGLDAPVFLAAEEDGVRQAVILGVGVWQWDLFPVQFGRGPYFRPLVSGLVEWLSEPSLLQSTGCEPSSYSLRAGQPLRFIARTGGAGGARIEVAVGADHPDSQFVLAFGSGGEAESEPLFLPPGSYHYEAARIDESGRELLGEGTFLVDSSSVEYDDPRPDPAFLERTAARTGGSVHRYPEVAPLVEQLREEAAGAGVTLRFDPRREPAGLVILLSLFFVELIVRRRRGLP